MNYLRSILIGSLVWLLLSISFMVLGFVPYVKESLNLQAMVAGILLIPFSILGASIYYKNGNKDKGIALGLIMALTALCLDAIITVPFVEIPKGGSYQSFYTYPLLWVMVIINIATVFTYWRLRVKTN